MPFKVSTKIIRKKSRAKYGSGLPDAREQVVLVMDCLFFVFSWLSEQ